MGKSRVSCIRMDAHTYLKGYWNGEGRIKEWSYGTNVEDVLLIPIDGVRKKSRTLMWVEGAAESPNHFLRTGFYELRSGVLSGNQAVQIQLLAVGHHTHVSVQRPIVW